MSDEGVESKWPVQIVVANPGTIMLVDDDGGFDFEQEYFLIACEQAGFNCVVVDSRYPLGIPEGVTDRLLVWNTSLSWSDTILPEQEEFLARFLDSGGRLMMVSADYLYDSGLTPFAQEYLHVTDYVDVPMGAWDGIEGDPITHGMSFVGEYELGSKMPCGRFNASRFWKANTMVTGCGLRLDMQMFSPGGVYHSAKGRAAHT